MESFGSQRLREFIDYLKSEGKVYNDTDFCNQISKNRQQVSQVLTGGRTLTPEFALHIARFFPELNFKYLIEEPCHYMLVKDKQNKEYLFNETTIDPFSENDKDIDRLLKIIEAQTKQIDQLVQTVVRLTSK